TLCGRTARLAHWRKGGRLMADKYSLVAGDEIRWSTLDGLFETPEFHVIARVTESAYVVYPEKGSPLPVSKDLVVEFKKLAPTRVSVELPPVERNSAKNSTADCIDGYPVQVYLDAKWSDTIFFDLNGNTGSLNLRLDEAERLGRALLAHVRLGE